MKPTTFLSIIGISGLFLISYFQFNFNNNENETEIKVPEPIEVSLIDADHKKHKQTELITPVPEIKISDPSIIVGVDKPTKDFNKEGNKKEEIKKEEPKVIRDPDSRKDFANVFWKRQYTLFDLMSDEPIFPILENGQNIYKIYYSSNEDPNPYSGSFTLEQLERHLFYKFKDLASCQKFCDSKK
jgi:hypothetical protein